MKKTQKKRLDSRVRQGFFDVPPLRYTGAKWQIAEWIIEKFPPHDTYVEPFCGSAAVFMRKHRSAIEVLNDMDGEIVNFFDVLRTQTDELVRAIELTPYARAEYERAFEPCDDPLERARRFYVAVWQSFGGTIVNKSGWRHQKLAKQRSSLTDTWRRTQGLLDAANRLKDAQIDNLDAVECIKHYDAALTLFYVDPPYVLSTRSNKRRYKHEMSDEDHRQLASVLHQVEGMVLISGYDSALYNDLYGDWTKLEKTSTTSGNNNSVEVLWLSPLTVQNALPLFAQMEASHE